MSSPSEDRLLRLESHVAHLERLCEQLNQIVTEQSRQLTRLQSQQQKMSRTLEAAELERIKSTDAKPPHWGK
ncbi:MAG: SlyX family protein [Verrucomicrobia bacterium]|nr:SlyX family protein [Verrucomicrobiota bacterium]